MSDLLCTEEAAAYLEANGYTRLPQKGTKTDFIKGDTAVAIDADSITVLTLDDGEPGQRRPGYVQLARLSGLGTIKTFFDWTLLFHALKIVTLKEFINNVKNENDHPNPVPAVNHRLGGNRLRSESVHQP